MISQLNWFDHNSHFVIRCGTCQKNYIYLLFWFLITNILGQILQKFVRGQDNRCFVKVKYLEIYLIWKNRKSLTPPCFIQDIGLLNLVTMTLEMYTPPPHHHLTTTTRHSAVLGLWLVLPASRDWELSSSFQSDSADWWDDCQSSGVFLPRSWHHEAPGCVCI